MLRQAIFAHKPQVFLRRVQKGRDPFVPDRVKPALASLEKGQILRILRSGPVAQPVRRLQDLLCRIAAAVNVDFVSRIWAAGLRRSRPRWIRAASDPKRRELRPGLSGAGREAFPVIIHKGKHEEICLCKCIIKEQLIRRPGTALCRLPLRADVKNVLHSFPLATTTSSV